VANAFLADELDATWLKQRYLYGIDLTDDDGVAYPNELFEHSIESAIDIVEDELDIVLRGMHAITDERRDAFSWSPLGYHLQVMNKRPVRSVSAISLQWGSFPRVELPTDWIRLTSATAGLVQIVVSGGEGATVLGIPGGALTGQWMGLDAGVPGLQVYDYVAGFESARFGLALGTFASNFSIDGHLIVRPSAAPGADTFTATISGTNKSTGVADTEVLTWTGTVRERKQSAKSWTDLTSVVFATDGATTPTFDLSGADATPLSILDAIGLVASILPLDTAGDLIAGAGIASKSLSLDSISQNINTTSSATNSGYGARALSYGKRLKTMMPQLKNRWTPTMVGAI